jgi:hypothetical protein
MPPIVVAIQREIAFVLDALSARVEPNVAPVRISARVAVRAAHLKSLL